MLVQERASTSFRTSSYPQHQEEEESDEFEDVDEEELVRVGGQAYTYQEVAQRGQELINLMTPQEKETYIRIGQRLYEDMEE